MGVSFCTMIGKLVIIFALVYACHGVVDGSEIISDDRKDSGHKSTPGPEVCKAGETCAICNDQMVLGRLDCIYGWYDGICKPCGITDRKCCEKSTCVHCPWDEQTEQDCLTGWYDGMMKPCAETDRKCCNIVPIVHDGIPFSIPICECCGGQYCPIR